MAPKTTRKAPVKTTANSAKPKTMEEMVLEKGFEFDSRFIDRFEFDLNNVTILYPFFFIPDSKYTPVWKVTIILDDDTAEKMKAKGFLVKYKEWFDEEGEVPYIVAKRKTHTSAGKAMYPPQIYDSGIVGKRRPQKWDETLIIGNGSIANVKVSTKYQEVAGEATVPLYLEKAQIVELVEYDGSGFDAVGEDDGDNGYEEGNSI